MAFKNKKNRREGVANNFPLVSVVIPMYNSAKFIPQTLESLLYQTMRNFEVIVVDDCSTDNSVEVVESFAEKFDGRLHVIKLPKNTGTPGLPRNVGIQFAHGKYIAFLDSDDLFTKTALEELTTLAEKFQAEVVHMQSNFILWGGKYKSIDETAMTDMNELTNQKNFTLQTYHKEKLSAPTFESEDLAERVRKWITSAPNNFWATCLSFYRRDFLITNQIFFPPMLTCEDATFSFEALCLSKKYLNVPNAVYIIRPREGSVSRDAQQITLNQHIHKRISALNSGFNEFEKVMGKIKFFEEHPDYRYAVLRWFANFRIPLTLALYTKIPVHQLNAMLRKEFQPDDAALSAYLFNTINIYQLQIMKLQQELKQLKDFKS